MRSAPRALPGDRSVRKIDFLYDTSLHVSDLPILLGRALLLGTAGVLIARLAHWRWWMRMASERDPARDDGEGVHNSILALIAFIIAQITTSVLASFGNVDSQIT